MPKLNNTTHNNSPVLANNEFYLVGVVNTNRSVRFLLQKLQNNAEVKQYYSFTSHNNSPILANNGFYLVGVVNTNRPVTFLLEKLQNNAELKQYLLTFQLK